MEESGTVDMGQPIYLCKAGSTLMTSHILNIELFSPVPERWYDRLACWFTGKYAEYNVPTSILAKGEGREGTLFISNESRIRRLY